MWRLLSWPKLLLETELYGDILGALEGPGFEGEGMETAQKKVWGWSRERSSWDRLCIWILCVIFLGQQGGDHCIPQVMEVLAQLCVQEPLPQLFYHLDVFRLFLALSHVFGYDPQKLPVPLSLTSLSSHQSPRAVQTPLQFFSHLWNLPSL